MTLIRNALSRDRGSHFPEPVENLEPVETKYLPKIVSELRLVTFPGVLGDFLGDCVRIQKLVHFQPGYSPRLLRPHRLRRRFGG